MPNPLAGNTAYLFEALVEWSDGVLYGATRSGGRNNRGTIFRLNKDGSGYNVLFSFKDPSPAGEAWYPDRLLEGSDGAIYGTTEPVGTNGGTVFTLNKDGTGFNVVYLFHPYPSDQTSDGEVPSSLIEGTDGTLYGTTRQGGGINGGQDGTVFKLNKDGGAYSILHRFHLFYGDGENPAPGLLEGSDGAIYGVTEQRGTVFKLNKDGSAYTILHVFSSAELTFTKVSGLQYQVLRSTNLPDFNVLGTITMPASGVYTNTDNLPPTPAAYYRAAWLP